METPTNKTESAGPAQAIKALVSISLGVLKEPRGFIKVIQFVLAIFAFATTTSHSSSTTFTANCGNSSSRSVTFSYGYPYDLEKVCFLVPVCGPNGTGSFCLLSGSRSSAQFYVFVGVFVFLYCLAALIMYIVFDNVYRRYTRIVIVDFIISIVLTILWVISSSAWAAGVSDIKMYTNPADAGIFGAQSSVVDCRKEGSCRTDSLGNFASLNVSIIFGFLNFVVWLGNLWFLYKETPWFKVQAKPPSQPGAASETDPQKV